MIFFLMCLGAVGRKYCRYTKSPWLSPSQVNENLTSVGFQPTTTRLDRLMLYRLSYEASAGAGRGNLGSESL